MRVEFVLAWKVASHQVLGDAHLRLKIDLLDCVSGVLGPALRQGSAVFPVGPGTCLHGVAQRHEELAGRGGRKQVGGPSLCGCQHGLRDVGENLGAPRVGKRMLHGYELGQKGGGVVAGGKGVDGSLVMVAGPVAQQGFGVDVHGPFLVETPREENGQIEGLQARLIACHGRNDALAHYHRGGGLVLDAFVHGSARGQGPCVAAGQVFAQCGRPACRSFCNLLGQVGKQVGRERGVFDERGHGSIVPRFA